MAIYLRFIWFWAKFSTYFGHNLYAFGRIFIAENTIWTYGRMMSRHQNARCLYEECFGENNFAMQKLDNAKLYLGRSLSNQNGQITRVATPGLLVSLRDVLADHTDK